MCPDENDSFMTGAKEYIKDLEKKRYPVLIAGKVLQIELSFCLNRTTPKNYFLVACICMTQGQLETPKSENRLVEIYHMINSITVKYCSIALI